MQENANSLTFAGLLQIAGAGSEPEEFGSVTEARVIIEDWRNEYNTYRPHSALGALTPTEYVAKGRETRKTNQITHNPWTIRRHPRTPERTP